MRVGVIIPAFNRADLIGETLNSILGQSLPPAEVIVVDDGSSDDTAGAVGRFGNRVRYHRIQNSGAPVARQVGAGLATGDWLWFADSDDLWEPQFLETALALAAADPAIGFVFGDFRIVRNSRWEERSKFADMPPDFWKGLPRRRVPEGWIVDAPLYPAILGFQPVFPSAVVMRRSLYDAAGGYDARFARTGSEDFEFTLRCVQTAPIGCIERPLVGIRKHEGNFSGTQVRNLCGEVEILKHALVHHALGPVHADRIRAEIGHRSAEAFDLAFSLGRFDLIAPTAADFGPGDWTAKRRVKRAIAGLPGPTRGALHRLIGAGPRAR